MVEILEENEGSVIIMDGTHYRSSYRKEAIALLKSYGYRDITAVVVNTPLETCLKRNSQRDRHVPTRVIERMHSSLQASLKRIDSDGFSEVQYV